MVVDLVRDSIVKVGQPVPNSPKVNDSDAKWKQLTDRAEAVRHTLCKLLDAQAPLTGLSHVYAATHKEMRDSLQPRRKTFRKQNKTSAERETESLMLSAAPRKKDHFQLTKTREY
jgi:hypothetical protein